VPLIFEMRSAIFIAILLGFLCVPTLAVVYRGTIITQAHGVAPWWKFIGKYGYANRGGITMELHTSSPNQYIYFYDGTQSVEMFIHAHAR